MATALDRCFVQIYISHLYDIRATLTVCRLWRDEVLCSDMLTYWETIGRYARIHSRRRMAILLIKYFEHYPQHYARIGEGLRFDGKWVRDIASGTIVCKLGAVFPYMGIRTMSTDDFLSLMMEASECDCVSFIKEYGHLLPAEYRYHCVYRAAWMGCRGAIDVLFRTCGHYPSAELVQALIESVAHDESRVSGLYVLCMQ